MPVVLDIAERARQRARPDAWIIDFTNPVGIVTRALLDAGHRAIGLCNVAIGFQRNFAGLLGVEPGQVTLDHVGLNHLTWERAVMVDGEDGLPDLIAGHGDEIAGHVDLPEAVLHETGTVPSYYLRYFWCHDEVAGRAADPADPGAGRGQDGAGTAGHVRRPGAGPQAGAAGAARRRVLLRGRGRAARLAGRRPPATPRW